MDNVQLPINLSANLHKVKQVLDEMKFTYDYSEKGEIVLGLNDKEFFVDVLITENVDLNRIVFFSKQRNLAFSSDIIPAVKDIISDINDEIPYGHIIMDISDKLGFALFKSFVSTENITKSEIEYNLMACIVLVKRYFSEFSHFGIIS